MAKVVDVTPIPDLPGAGHLHFDDGRPPLLVTPEIADDYRAHLGINAMDNGVAGPGTGTPDHPYDRPGESTAATKALGSMLTEGNYHPHRPAWLEGPRPQLNADGVPVAAAAAANTAYSAPQAAPPPQQAAAPQAAPPTPQGGGVPPMLARPPEPTPAAPEQAPAGPAAPPSTDDLVAQANDAARRKAADELLNGKVVPGSAGRPGGYQPSTQKVTTEAGPAYDTGQAGMRIDADRQLLDAKLAQANALKLQADEQAAKAAAALPVLQQQQAAAQAEVDRKRQDYQQQRVHLENELQSYSETAKPDPSKFFRERGPIGNIMSVLGQALGAAGATLGHTPNFAFEYAQSQIKNDMEAQRAAYEGGRADRNNALARFTSYYHGDMDMAQNALTIAMNKVVATEALQFAQQSQSKQQQAAAQVIAAQFAKDSLDREQAMYNASLGKTTTTTEDKYQTAQGASGPHRKDLTDAERAARLKEVKGGKDQGALGLTAQGVARQKANYSTKTEALASFADSLSHRATLMGVHFDPKTGELTNKDGKPVADGDLDVPVGAGLVGKHVAGDVLTPKAMELRRAEENSVRLHAAAVYNHSISAEEGSAEVDHTIGSTDAAKLANMRYLAEEYRKRKLAIDTGAASIDPRIVNERDAAEKAVNYARATGKPLPGPGARTGADNGDTSDSYSESDSP